MAENNKLIAEITTTENINDPNKLSALYKRHEATSLPPSLLVHKARVIQLSDGLDYTLKDAEETLRKALEIDPNNLDAWIEMGYLLYAVNDDALAALDFFEQGIIHAQQAYTELKIGKIKCLIELNKLDEALESIKPSNQTTNPIFAQLEIEVQEKMILRQTQK